MEQQNKYYTPDISELHIGYELEVEDFNQGHENGVQWIKAIIVHGGTIERDTHEQIFDGTSIQGIEARNDVYIRNTYRTKYLDQSDIENCGWEIDVEKEKRRKNHVTAPYISKGKNGMLSQHGENYMISTIIGPPTEDSYGGLGQPMYMGPIKSINELRIIMKYLNIK